ncbi:P-II family nitrogen regulator [Humitalea sp. 24SJ18S-53]|uniref:P-II family nitrogen regulator n=1 Tax=Humitalea sp. 24SJ18S-53 TaxID=3422307 RepID=UPI003D66D9FE
MNHPRKRIEIVVEQVQAETVTELLERLGATGWTMLPVMAGRGRQGLRQGGVPGGVLDNVMIVAIVSAEVAIRVADARDELLDARPAIISISDCAVLRAEHF